MEIQITGKNVELLPTVRSYIERKLGKLSRHLPNISESVVEITEEKTRSPQHRFVVQVTLNSHGTLLRGEERGQDLYTAVDRVAEVMNRQIERYKGKLYDKGRGYSLARSESGEEEASPQPRQRVVKTKQFVIKPMSVEEAIDQMALLGHDFFLFFNAETEKVNLLYQRKDDNYGLIEPELG